MSPHCTPPTAPRRRRPRLTTTLVFLLGGVLGALTLQVVAPDRGPDRAPAHLDLAPAAAQPSRARADEPATAFRIASLNVLGDSHTVPGGNRPGWASGQQRMTWQVQVLRNVGADVIGFQELEKAQYRTFTKLTRGEYSMWPGNIDGRGFLRNSIAWRSAQWTLLDTSWIKVPYFDGELLRMPVVLLQHATTGQQAYVMNFHNPSDSRGPAARWRAQGRVLQTDLVNKLRASTGLPVFWTGDFNDREKAFCQVTKRSPMVAANGGTNAAGSCQPPPAMQVDWIFGTSETAFEGYVVDRRKNIRRSTDHPLVLATAVIPPGLTPLCPTQPVDG